MENDQTERKVAAGRCYTYNKVHISRFIQNMYSPSFPCLTGVGPERGAGTTFKRARFFPTLVPLGMRRCKWWEDTKEGEGSRVREAWGGSLYEPRPEFQMMQVEAKELASCRPLAFTSQYAYHWHTSNIPVSDYRRYQLSMY